MLYPPGAELRSAMDPVTGFSLFLGLTVVLLGVDVITGLRGMLPLHLFSVAATLASLGLAIFYAEKLGKLYDLEAAGVITPIHLTLAKITTASYLLMVVTGIQTLRDRAKRRVHRGAALVVLTLTVITAGTGVTMILLSERLAPDGETTASETANSGSASRP